MYGQDRKELRAVFFRAWQREREGLPLSGVEPLIVDIVRRHPEYHALLEAPERYQDADFTPEMGRTNPFLHLAMHLAVAEQLAVDQPAGLRGLHRRLLLRAGDEHAAAHAIMECLGETLWRAQHHGLPPDQGAYLDCIKRQAGEPS